MNTPEDFQRQYLGIPWQDTPEEKRLKELAEQYCQDTEQYDRMVCTGPVINGAIMPVGPEQHSLITRHANALFRRMAEEARNMGFRSADLQARVQENRRPK